MTRTTLAFVLAAAFVASTPCPNDAAPPDWEQLGREATEVLRSLLRADTTNPPGNEAAAAAVVRDALARHRIETQILESSPGRASLVARVAGRSGGRPVVLLSHLDVVPANAGEWTHPPFGGEMIDGVVHGRGALDDKGLTAIQVVVLGALHDAGALDRDVLLVATADEETGGRAGAGWLTREHPELLANAEFLLTEGDHIHLRPEGPAVAQVAVAEKTPCWVEMVASGPPGHGSTPARDTSVTRLVRALDRLDRLATPIRVVGPVAEYFAAIAPRQPPALRRRLLDLGNALRDPAFRDDFLRNPRQNALVRDTITPTVLEASHKTNVIPSEARAELDCRLLPGDDPAAFLELLRKTVADPQVRLSTMLSFPASASPATSAMMTAIRETVAEEFPDATVVPSVIPGFTDSHYFRALGIESYGFIPFALSEADERGVHGVDEKISTTTLRDGVRRLTALLRRLR